MLLYIKMVITVFVSLYTIRVVLSSIGVNDFGIFNLIAGIVAMLSFLSSSMTVSTQRFFSSYLGEDNKTKLNSAFQTSILLNLILAGVLVILLELAGYFFIFDFINVEPERLIPAYTVYQLVILNTLINLGGLSFDAVIISREDLHIDAITGVCEVICRLFFAFTISSHSGDKLVYYTLTIVFVTFLSRLAKISYSFLKYDEVTIKNYKIDRLEFKKMSSFFGWNTFGAASGVIRNQGIAMVINIFFGTILNASYGISLQVNSQIKNFSENLLKSVRPQIFKLEGANRHDDMIKSCLIVSKLGYFLVLLVGLPIIFEIDLILATWLFEVPVYTNILCQLSIILVLVNITSNGIQTALQAVGKIKLYMLTVGSLIMTTPLISIFLLINKYPIYFVLIASIFVEVLAVSVRMIILSKYSSFKSTWFLIKVILPISKVSFASVLLAYLIYLTHKADSIMDLIINSFCMSTMIVIFIYFLGLDNSEKKFVRSKIHIIFKKFNYGK